MKQAKVLTDHEFKRVLAVIAQSRHADRNRAAMMLSHLAGLRVAEIASLRVSDVLDPNGHVLDQIALRAVVTKNREHRVVPVNAKLRHELQRYVATLTQRDRAAPLLLTQKRTAFSANTLCQLFSQTYASVGIPNATSHSGRRWFITKLAHSGISAKVIMTLAGHKHLSTTQRYIDVNDQMLRKAVDVL